MIVGNDRQPPTEPGVASVAYGTPEIAGLANAVPPHANGRTWIAVAGAGRIRPLQFLPDVAASSCTAIASYVACTTALDTVTVWPLSVSTG